MLLTSILALKHAPLSLVIVLRNTSPLGTLVFERFYPEPLRISGPMLGAILMMMIGQEKGGKTYIYVCVCLPVYIDIYKYIYIYIYNIVYMYTYISIYIYTQYRDMCVYYIS